MKSKNPSISVLLPVGRDKRFLKEALESIRSQTFKDFEILMQEDDGRGITQVLIDLTRKAKGEFLARMDADDVNEPDRFEKQINFLRSHPDVMLAGTWATLIDENGKEIGLQSMPESWEGIKKEIFCRNPLIHPSWMMRRSWFEKAGGYNSAYKYSQDWEFLLRNVWKGRVENIPEPLIKLRIHQGSISFSNNRQQVYFGLKARLESIFRGDVRWTNAVYLVPSIIALIIPIKFKFIVRNNVIPAEAGIYLNRFRIKSGTTGKKTLGLVMPIGQNKEQLLESGQWNLWQSEIEEYRKHFGVVEVFEFKYRDWRRFFEAKLISLFEAKRFRRCSVLKAVHLSASIPCLVAKFLYGIPFVLSFGYRYDEFAKIENKWFQWIFVKLLEPLAVKFADLVLVPTEDLGKYVRNLGAKSIEVIPNGVDVNLFSPKPASKGYTLKGATFLNILFVGRLERQKNLKVLIQAVSKISRGLALLKQSQALINLQFVGAGSQKEELVGLADKLGVNLKITERVPNEQLPDIYRRADIFALPSLAEGHPKALLEAMSCGLACVASNIPGINEIITDNENGLLVESTRNGLGEGLKRLIEDMVLRQRLGISARKTVLERFDKNRLMEIEARLLSGL